MFISHVRIIEGDHHARSLCNPSTSVSESCSWAALNSANWWRTDKHTDKRTILTSASMRDLSVTPPLACLYRSFVSDNCSWAALNSANRCSNWLLMYFSRLLIFSSVRVISSWSLSRYDLVSVNEASIPSLCWCICSTCTRQSCNGKVRSDNKSQKTCQFNVIYWRQANIIATCNYSSSHKIQITDFLEFLHEFGKKKS